MFDTEGSVEVDEVGSAATAEEETTETQETQPNEGKDNEASQDNQQGDDGGQPDGSDEQVTDKGTRLAQDPLQQANQLRANAERQLKNFEQYFSDPSNVEAYLKELKKERGTQDQPAQDQPAQPAQPGAAPIDPDKIETVDDLRTYAKWLKQDMERQIAEVKQGHESFVATQRESAVAQKISSQIDEARSKYPLLRPTNPDGTPNPEFDPELEERLGKAFERLDMDPNTGRFRGQVDFLQLTEDFMSAAQRGEKNGSQKAQTIIKDRRAGRVTSSSTTASEPDESQLTASQLIAQRIQRAAQGRTR